MRLARSILARTQVSTRVLNNARYISNTRYLCEEKDQKDAEKETIQNNEIEELKKKLEESNKLASSMKDNYLRSLAEMENVRQRSDKEVEKAKQFAIQKFVKDLLGSCDVLTIALKTVTQKNLDSIPELKDFYTGVDLTEKELMATLKRYGVEKIECEDVFDPNLHQALYQAPCPGKETGSILSVEKLGYTLNGRVIRPAQVGVVKN